MSSTVMPFINHLGEAVQGNRVIDVLKFCWFSRDQPRFDQCVVIPALQKSVVCSSSVDRTCWKAFADHCILTPVGFHYLNTKSMWGGGVGFLHQPLCALRNLLDDHFFYLLNR